MSNKDFYKVLQVNREAGSLTIKRAYRTLVLQVHPDRVVPEQKAAAEETFKELTEAYFVLGNTERRNMYNQQQTAEDSIYKTSETWNFVEPVQSFYDKDIFETYYRDQRRNSEALLPDGRDVLGGGIAKLCAAIFIVMFFFVRQGTFEAFPLIYLGMNTPLPLPVFAAVIYIMAEPFREFFWQYFAEDPIYDITALLVSWLVILIFAFVVFSRVLPFAPLIIKEKEPDSAKINSRTINQKIYPVNLETFHGSTFDPSQQRAPALADQI